MFFKFFSDCASPIVEPLIHCEAVYENSVSPMLNGDDDTKFGRNDGNFHYDFSNVDGNDEDSSDQLADQIDDINFPEYIGSACNLCSTPMFNTYKEMQSHYRNVHDVKNGGVTCCGQQFYAISLIADHIAYHNNPDIFR